MKKDFGRIFLVVNALALISTVVVARFDGWSIAFAGCIASFMTSALYYFYFGRQSVEAEQDERFKQFADLMPYIIWAASPEGKIYFYNKAWFEMVGVDPKAKIPEDGWQPIMVKEEIPVVRKLFYECIQAGKPYQQELRLKDPISGEFRWVLAKALPVRDSNGNINRWYGTCYDIHDLKTALRARDDFLSIASHELKTPMSALQLQLQLASLHVNPKTGEVPKAADLAKSLDLCNRQVERLVHLIENLLDVSRIAAGRVKYEYETFDLAHLAKDILNQFAEQFKARGIIVTQEFDKPVIGEWDKTRTSQIIENLIANALKYAPGKPLIFSCKTHDDHAVIKVKDQGPGIPTAKHSAIFERFERATPLKHASGLGLGLYICKEIVEAMGGSIAVNSQPDQGAEFTVQLPLHQKSS